MVELDGIAECLPPWSLIHRVEPRLRWAISADRRNLPPAAAANGVQAPRQWRVRLARTSRQSSIDRFMIDMVRHTGAPRKEACALSLVFVAMLGVEREMLSASSHFGWLCLSQGDGELGRVCWTGGHAHQAVSIDSARQSSASSTASTSLPCVTLKTLWQINPESWQEGRSIVHQHFDFVGATSWTCWLAQDNVRLRVCVVDRCGKKRTSCSGLT